MKRRTRLFKKSIGLIVTAAGVIIVAFAVPPWFWSMLLGLLLILLGGYVCLRSR